MRGRELLLLLQPYFWPDGWANRVRVVLTWIALGASRVMSIMAPLFVGRATDMLVRDHEVPWVYISLYCALTFGSTGFKQLQAVFYMRVKQTAFAQVSSFTFRHIHSLSLQYHLNKKLGNVLRSIDRGISSAETVVSAVFLLMLPALVECTVVFVIFYMHYNEPQLSALVFAFVVAYLVLTVKLTLMRKSLRRAANKYDNELHDRATDSLINYETVKYFGNEEYETARYTEAVTKFQVRYRMLLLHYIELLIS